MRANILDFAAADPRTIFGFPSVWSPRGCADWEQQSD
jgi:hypothetical protein